MRSQDERHAAHELLCAAAIVPLTVVAHEVIPGTDEGEFALRLAFSFADEESPEEDRARPLLAMRSAAVRSSITTTAR